MEPDRQVVPRHRVEERHELRRGDRPAQRVREELNAPRAKLLDGTPRLSGGSLRIVEWKRSDERGKALRKAADQLRHPVIRYAGQVDRGRPVRERFDRRRRDRQDLLVPVEAVHDPEADLQVDQHRDVPHPFADVLVVGRDLHHPAEVRFGVDVVEDIDLAHASFPGNSCAMPMGDFFNAPEGRIGQILPRHGRRFLEICGNRARHLRCSSCDAMEPRA